MIEKTHEPVLTEEIVGTIFEDAHLKVNSHLRLIDATVGLGGHSVEFVNRGAYVLGIDADLTNLKVAQDSLKKACPTPNAYSECFSLVHGNFIDIAKIAKEEKIGNVDAVLFDLGVNSPQLTSETRGFSFGAKNAKLDMRIDVDSQSVTAADLLNSLREDQLLELFLVTCDFRTSQNLTKSIVQKRRQSKFIRVSDLLDVVPYGYGKTHPATKVFLALRIAVNSELENLSSALPDAFGLLKKHGILIVISFHSGEDRVVKRFYNKLKKATKAEVSDKPILPRKIEIRRNPRSRSAKMRVAKKL